MDNHYLALTSTFGGAKKQKTIELFNFKINKF